MIKTISQVALLSGNINQEPGSMPGEGLTALQTFTYFVAAPVGLFIAISVIVWAMTSKRQNRSSASVITTIE